jgi:predicted transposase/invertase (TIGR01784 family)
MKAKFINPFIDFGFNKIFGEEASKPLLLDFLNALLPEWDKIVELTFKLGETNSKWKDVYEIYCENEKGEKFIVELQKAKKNFFSGRTRYYNSFPIMKHAEEGFWDSNMKAVYCIGILDFTFDHYKFDPKTSEFKHTIKLKNQNGKTYYEKLTFIYFELPNFQKNETELETRLDKWLFFIKHLEDFETIPQIMTDEVFKQAFEKAELSNIGSEEINNYEKSLKIFRDFNGALDTAFNEGKLAGILEVMLERKMETAKELKKMGILTTKIIEATDLTEEEIEKL